MKALAAIERYLRTHRRPVTAKQLAKHFLYSPPTVGTALRRLVEMGEAEVHSTIGSTKYYTRKMP
jgi:DNA-binding MarR family transcriptional regulator